MKKIQDLDLKNKKVLMRVDFNVGIENEDVKEKFKIEACKESVSYALSKGAKLALVSHLGRPEGEINEEFSFKQLVDDVERILSIKIKFVSDCIGDSVANALENVAEGEVILLENVRFHEGEEKNDEDFASQLASPFDVYINDAFSVCHRDQASVSGITKHIPSYAGFWLQKEIENLEKVLTDPARPATAIIGGAKIETKLPLIKKFEKIYDYVLVGGRVANEALDQEVEFSDKVFLPIDFQGDRLDIGKKTCDKFVEIIRESNTIVWNGPLGKFEEEPYDKSTRDILKEVVDSNAFTLLGGGESVEVLEENNMMDEISFVSTGGGAMLEYLSGKKMPGIESLK